jgi:hypothetical protein
MVTRQFLVSCGVINGPPFFVVFFFYVFLACTANCSSYFLLSPRQLHNTADTETHLFPTLTWIPVYPLLWSHIEVASLSVVVLPFCMSICSKANAIP